MQMQKIMIAEEIQTLAADLRVAELVEPAPSRAPQPRYRRSRAKVLDQSSQHVALPGMQRLAELGRPAISLVRRELRLRNMPTS
jgi:hypothetical protein